MDNSLSQGHPTGAGALGLRMAPVESETSLNPFIPPFPEKGNTTKDPFSLLPWGNLQDFPGMAFPASGSHSQADPDSLCGSQLIPSLSLLIPEI